MVNLTVDQESHLDQLPYFPYSPISLFVITLILVLLKGTLYALFRSMIGYSCLLSRQLSVCSGPPVFNYRGYDFCNQLSDILSCSEITLIISSMTVTYTSPPHMINSAITPPSSCALLFLSFFYCILYVFSANVLIRLCRFLSVSIYLTRFLVYLFKSSSKWSVHLFRVSLLR